MRRAICLTFWIFLLHSSAAIAGQAAAQLVGPQQIPRSGFRTWSLFLICTPDWVTPERSGDLANLYRRFQAFGDAIGRDNLAVWFWRRQGTLDDARLSENVDVPRSTDYCQALSLRPSDGPFLVVTMAYPELAAFPRERAVFALGGLQPAELAKLLNTLTDQLLLEGKVATARAAATAASPPPAAAGSAEASSGFWLQLLEGARRSLIGAGCAVKMQITTGFLSAELRGCQS